MIEARNVGSRIVSAETLTATETGRPTSSHRLAWASDWRRIDLVNRAMRPVCSASGTKTSGRTSTPLRFHRARTSTCVTVPVRRSSCGW